MVAQDSKISKIKEIPITFKIDGIDKKFVPDDNMTPTEIFQIMSTLLGSVVGANIDTDYYIKENNLEKYFIEERIKNENKS